MLHLDIKKLGRFNRPGHKVTADRTQNSRGAGWEYVHVAIDDHSRLAMASVHPDESAASACAALLQAVRYYRSLGIRFVRVLTDNGVAYRSRKFQRLCRRLGVQAKRTRPYTPRTNGKAERFIQTALREWAYARSCTIPQASVPSICRAGCIATTGTESTPASATNHPSAVSRFH